MLFVFPLHSIYSNYEKKEKKKKPTQPETPQLNFSQTSWGRYINEMYAELIKFIKNIAIGDRHMTVQIRSLAYQVPNLQFTTDETIFREEAQSTQFSRRWGSLQGINPRPGQGLGGRWRQLRRASRGSGPGGPGAQVSTSCCCRNSGIPEHPGGRGLEERSRARECRRPAGNVWHRAAASARGSLTEASATGSSLGIQIWPRNSKVTARLFKGLCVPLGRRVPQINQINVRSENWTGRT